MNAQTLAQLKQRVVRNPDDVGARRVLADVLVEAGDPRGLFIQVQCDLAELPADDARRPALESVERDLLSRYEAHWRAPIHPTFGTVKFVRGFVEEWSCDAPDFIAAGSRVVAKTPLRRAALIGVTPARFRHLARLRAFLEMPELELTTIREWPTGLLPPTRFERLRYLHLRDEPKVTSFTGVDALVAELVEAPWWPGLAEARLDWAELRLGALAQTSADLSAVTALSTNLARFDERDWAVFARLPKLHTLSLDVRHVSPTWSRGLAWPPTLRALALTSAVLDHEAVAGLVASSLQQLTLRACTCTSPDVAAQVRERFGVALTGPVTTSSSHRPPPAARPTVSPPRPGWWARLTRAVTGR